MADFDAQIQESQKQVAEAQARIDQTIALLDGLSPDALDAAPDHPIEHALPNGMTFDLTAELYARDWTLAQFYFHVMTAYAILRSRDVEASARMMEKHCESLGPAPSDKGR